jgi:hypothetical protein
MPEERHILLVDDNPDDRAIIREFLSRVEDCAYRITEVVTAEALMALCGDGHPDFDLLLLDYLLPDSDGMTILRDLRAPESRWQHVPIIMLTGFGDETLAVRAIKGGAQDYIPKSTYSAERLHLAIGSAIESLRTQISLRQREERYRALVSATAQFVWGASPQGDATYSSEAWELLTGQTQEDLMARQAFDYMHPDDREQFAQAWQRAVAAKTPFHGEQRIRARDGSYRDIEVRGVPIFNPDGSVREWAGISVDITARKEAERALEAANERFWLAAEAVQAIIFDLDVARNHVTRTVGLTTLLGYQMNEVEPTREWWRERIHPEDYDTSRAIVDEALRSKDSYSVQHRMFHKSGRVIHVWERGLIVRDSAGTPVRVVGSTLDITQQKELEFQHAELLRLEQQARERAEKASHIRLQFLGMVSHDLRTPLAAIKGFTTTLLARDVTFDIHQQRKFLTIIDQETDRLAALIDDLLEVSHLQSGTLSVERAPVRLTDILTPIQPQLQTLTKEHSLITSVSPALPPIHADARRIGQVLVNLVSNAAKFSPAGGDIEIRARALADALQVEVCDQGVGIPPDKREDVFNAFSQLKTEQRGKGAGLGLAICKSLVEMHGGTIWIEAMTPQGTCICFTLPLASDE